MFADLYDAVSFIWSWRWPSAAGRITAVETERLHHYRRGDTYQLAVAYEFTIGSDGPYTGESFWEPFLFNKRRALAARHRFHVNQLVTIRYRSDDPSVNRLDRSV